MARWHALAMAAAAAAAWGPGCGARELDFEALGGVAEDESLETAWSNGRLLNSTLNALQPGDELVFRSGMAFTIMGGVRVSTALRDVVVRIDGTLRLTEQIAEYPRGENGRVLAGIRFFNAHNLTLTSSKQRGTIDGSGQAWWGWPGIGYLQVGEDRPRLLRVTNSSDVVIERLLFVNSPYWTVYVDDVDGLVIRHSDISNRRTAGLGHKLLDLSAFNTDGFDVTGNDIHIHDCTVYTNDDSIAIKDGSSNVLVERTNTSGLGLTIGSIGRAPVRNVTFRNSYLQNSHKGLYLKFRRAKDLVAVSEVLFENILIEGNEQWPIWIGPAQQSDTSDLCFANPCSICWPYLPWATCDGQKNTSYSQLTLRNIEIRNPKMSPGVLLADPDFPMDGVIFDNVRVTRDCDAEVDFAAAFPQLPTDIDDPFVRRFLALTIAGPLCLTVVLAALCYRGHCRCCVDTPMRRCVCLAAVVAPALLLALWFGILSANMSDTSQYYVCQGVTNGVALGNTWPVPPCLEDRTTASVAAAECPSNPTALGLGTTAALLAAPLLAAAAAALRVARPDLYSSLTSSAPSKALDRPSRRESPVSPAGAAGPASRIHPASQPRLQFHASVAQLSPSSSTTGRCGCRPGERRDGWLTSQVI